jgi:Ca-activated chloride channel homolog
MIGYRGIHRKVSRAHGWRITLAPWLVISIVAVVVLSGAAVGYAFLLRSSCQGKPTLITIAASPDQYTALDEIAQQWRQTQPSVDGHCAGVDIMQIDSAEVVQALGPQWGTNSIPAPDVWVPEATTWVHLAATRPEAKDTLPDADVRLTSIASSPVVLAMPKQMANTIDYHGEQLSLSQLVDSFSPGGWSTFGHPEWGNFQLGWTDPRKAITGLNTLLALADGGAQRKTGVADHLAQALAVDQQVDSYQEASDGFLRRLSELKDPVNLANFPAFPALERDVAMFNTLNATTPLTPIYLAERPAAADYPYVVLTANWVSKSKKDIAASFLSFLTGPTARNVLRISAFRNPTGTIDGAEGVLGKDYLATVDLTQESHLPGPQIAQVLNTWTTQRGAIADQSIAASG